MVQMFTKHVFMDKKKNHEFVDLYNLSTKKYLTRPWEGKFHDIGLITD